MTAAAAVVVKQLQMHRDRPDSWDAWDINRHYRNVVRDLTDVDAITLDVDPEQRSPGSPSCGPAEHRPSASATCCGPAVRPWNSSLTSTGMRARSCSQLAVPLDLAAEVSRAETQFGHVARPTHTNTSWDEAQYEICAHRWVHVGEHGHGVGIANDSTYAHDVTRTTRDDAG